MPIVSGAPSPESPQPPPSLADGLLFSLPGCEENQQNSPSGAG